MQGKEPRHVANETSIRTAIKMTCEEIIVHQLALEGSNDLLEFEKKGYTFHRHVLNDFEQFLSVIDMKEDKIITTYYIAYVKNREQVEYIELNKNTLEGMTKHV